MNPAVAPTVGTLIVCERTCNRLFFETFGRGRTLFFIQEELYFHEFSLSKVNGTQCAFCVQNGPHGRRLSANIDSSLENFLCIA